MITSRKQVKMTTVLEQIDWAHRPCSTAKQTREYETEMTDLGGKNWGK